MTAPNLLLCVLETLRESAFLGHRHAFWGHLGTENGLEGEGGEGGEGAHEEEPDAIPSTMVSCGLPNQPTSRISLKFN